jgi:hypothetical protein
MLTDDRDGLRRGNVVARIPVVVPTSSVEVFLDDLLPARQSVTSAHRDSLRQRRNLSPQESSPALLQSLGDMQLRSAVVPF